MRSSSTELYCRKHTTKKELLHRVCLQQGCTDRGLLCRLCEKERHDGHDTEELSEVNNKIEECRYDQSAQQSLINSMKGVKEGRALAVKELKLYRDAVTKSIDQMEKQVHDFFDSFHRSL